METSYLKQHESRLYVFRIIVQFHILTPSNFEDAKIEDQILVTLG